MDSMKKSFVVLIILEVLVFIYLYVTLLNNSLTISNSEINKFKERNAASIDTKGNDNIEQSRGNKSRKSQFFANLEKGRQLTAVNVNATVIPIMKVQDENTEQDSKYKTLRFLKLNDRIRTNMTHTNNSPYISGGKSECAISFDRDSLIRARQKLLTSKYYLFYVHLEIDGFQIRLNEDRDDLLHWQYVVKTEKLLVQLPVDFDLLTYKLLVYDNEETTIGIKLVYNHSDCIQKDFSNILKSVRLLLWNDLFDNNTDYYLCNRNYNNESSRDVLYYITTIWVGYDLSCSEMSSKHGLFVFNAKKDHVPLVAPVFCYLLSLQFVWIFVLLDMQKHSNGPTKTKENVTLYPKTNKNIQAPESFEDKKTEVSYIHTANNTGMTDDNVSHAPKTKEVIPDIHTRNKTQMTEDKGTHPISYRDETNQSSEQTEVKRIYIPDADGANNTDMIDDSGTHTPEKEIEELGIDDDKKSEEESIEASKTGENKIILCPEYHPSDQLHIYTRNDRPYGIKRLLVSLFYQKCCFCKHCCCHNPAVRLIFLLWLFILLPFGLYRTIGRYCILTEIYEDYNTVVRPSEPLFFCIQIAEGFKVTLDAIYAAAFPFLFICFGCISYQNFVTSDRRICYDLEDNVEVLTTNSNAMSDLLTFRFHQFCRTMNKLLFPKGCCKDNTMCKKKSKKCCFNWFRDCYLFKCACLFCYCIFPIIPFSFPPDKCIDDFSLPENSNKAETNGEKKCLRVFCGSMKYAILYLLSYFFCLRPIISTFTFLFRSFTYFVFVALPIRVHILRFTILAVTTVTYFIQYVHEIVNMNVEILNYIFICEKKRKQRDVKYVDERLFDFIYGKILFVKKNLYFLVLKTIVVFMYLFITIETFVTNQTSLTGTTFKDMLEFLLIIIGPYAIALFLKANKDDFLTDDNKAEIEKKYNAFFVDIEMQCEPEMINTNICETSRKQNATPSETPSGSGHSGKYQPSQSNLIELQDMSGDSQEKTPLISKREKEERKIF